MLDHPTCLKLVTRIAIDNRFEFSIFGRLNRIVHHIHHEVVINQLALLHKLIHHRIILIAKELPD